MARKSSPGISYYALDTDHTTDKKIKCLFIEKGGDGYWVYKCFLDYIYRTRGYFYDTNDKKELLLFASDYCKKSIEFVWEVINSCIENDLFSKEIFDKLGTLTSKRIQQTYIYATQERRKKGTPTIIEREQFCISREEFNSSRDETLFRVVDALGKSLIAGNNSIVPGNNSLFPGSSTQSRVEYSKVEKSNTLTGIEQPKKLAFELDKSNSVSNETPVLNNKSTVDKKNKNAPTMQEPALPAPNPPSLDRDYSAPKNKAGKVPQNASRKKKVDNSEVPYWKELVDLWFTFCYEKYNAKPSFAGRDPKDFKEIILILKSRYEKLREESGDTKLPEWTETVAKSRLRNFLGVAYTDIWLKDNFLLSNLNKQKDKVFLNQITNSNGREKQQSTGKQSGKTDWSSIGKTMVFDKP